MIWKRHVLKPTVAVRATGSLWSSELGQRQRNCDPTHHILMTLGERTLMMRLEEVGDPMIGCAMAYAGVMLSGPLRDADLVHCYSNIA